MYKETPRIWKLLNLGEILRRTSLETQTRVNKTYVQKGHPPTYHVSLSGETTRLGNDGPLIKVYAANLDPLPYTVWQPKTPKIKCNEKPEANKQYSPHPFKLPQHPIAVEKKSEEELSLHLIETRGMGPCGLELLEKRIVPSNYMFGKERGLHLAPVDAEGGTLFSGSGYEALTYANNTVLIIRGGREQRKLLLVKPGASNRAKEFYFTSLRHIYNPAVYFLQPFALVRKTLYPGEQIASNLVMIGAGGSWVAVASNKPLRIIHEGDTILLRANSIFITTPPSKQLPYNIFPYWANIASKNPACQCRGPLILGGDPRLIVAESTWVREDREWTISLTLSNPTETPFLARFTVVSPYYISNASIDGSKIIPDDRSNIKVFIDSFNTGELELHLKESKLPALLRTSKQVTT